MMDLERHQDEEDQASTMVGRQHNWTSLFGLLPLALLCYVYSATQEERILQNPQGILRKGPNSNILIQKADETSAADDPFFEKWEEDDSFFEKWEEDSAGIVPMNGLWIHVDSWQESAEWQEVFADVLALAKRLEAVLVEPGVRTTQLDGTVEITALEGCAQGSNHALLDYYNHTLLEQYYNMIASCPQYHAAMNQLTDPTVIDVCFPAANKKEECSHGLLSDFSRHTSPTLNHGVEEALHNPNSLVVLRLFQAGGDELSHLSIQTTEPVRAVWTVHADEPHLIQNDFLKLSSDIGN